MPLPASFITGGYLTYDKLVKRARILIGSDGPTDSGKSEFAHSAPGPGIFICLDRQVEGMLRNSNPPAARRTDFVYKVVDIPVATQGNQQMFLEAWRNFYQIYTAALQNPDAKTVVVDGDGDSWELQRLAEFGKLTQIPPILYTNANAARRAYYTRAWDSGKIVIFTNKVKREYVSKLDSAGNPVMTNDGKEVRVPTGNYERQGFSDQDYLIQVQITHLYKPAGVNPITNRSTPQQWGLRINKCKFDRNLVGQELWGEDCNFAGLVQTVVPELSLSDWGL